MTAVETRPEPKLVSLVIHPPHGWGMHETFLGCYWSRHELGVTLMAFPAGGEWMWSVVDGEQVVLDYDPTRPLGTAEDAMRSADYAWALLQETAK